MICNYAIIVDDDFVTWSPFQLQIIRDGQVTDSIHAVAPKLCFTAFVSKQQAMHGEALHITRMI